MGVCRNVIAHMGVLIGQMACQSLTGTTACRHGFEMIGIVEWPRCLPTAGDELHMVQGRQERNLGNPDLSTPENFY